MVKLASWNVNSLTVRIDQVLAWFDATNIDILALQETKVTDDKFPLNVFKERGLYVAFAGQKTYNGVAIISRKPIEACITSIPGFDDPQRRVLAATIGDIRVINLYVPNGSEVGSDKYAYKLEWLSHVTKFIKSELINFPRVAVVGDFNIAPDDKDVCSPKDWEGCVLVSREEREAFMALVKLGLHDSFRNMEQQPDMYSWWDYRAASFRRNKGLRIDHILLSNALNNNCPVSYIDVEPRRAPRPSDHAPVWVEIH